MIEQRNPYDLSSPRAESVSKLNIYHKDSEEQSFTEKI